MLNRSRAFSPFGYQRKNLEKKQTLKILLDYYKNLKYFFFLGTSRVWADADCS